jgi:hypothetical protein
MSLDLSGGDPPPTSLRRPIDFSKIAYQLPQPTGIVPGPGSGVIVSSVRCHRPLRISEGGVSG